MTKFDLMVYVQRRPHMRSDTLEYSLCIGKGILHQIFDEERIDTNIKEAIFFYPERWLNIVEERSLYPRLEQYCPNLKKVTIITQSVYIIQCTAKDNLLIISSQDEIDRIASEGNITQESVAGRLWYDNAIGLSNNNGLLNV